MMFFLRLACITALLAPVKGFGQSCIVIESILVDACAPPQQEGLNEMVRFRTGNQALNVANMNVTWATVTNPWLGICQNANTAAKTAALNATIESCGRLLEPTNGVLPPNSKVLLVTSENMSPEFNSFANLSDTLYIIYQCGNTTTGHFANWGPGLRTLTIGFTPPGNCSSSVTYDRNLLITQAGVPGAEDGATVLFDNNGNATYINNGCFAPVQQLSATWTLPSGGSVCADANPINLNNLVTGNPGGTWSGQGVSGSFFNPSGLSGNIPVTYTVIQGACSTSVTQNIVVVQPNGASWTPPPPFCSSLAPVDFNQFVTGIPGGSWAGPGITNGIFNPGLFPNGVEVLITYTVGQGNCIDSESHNIIVSSSPQSPQVNPTSLVGCSGQSFALSAISPTTGTQVNWYADAALTTLLAANSNTLNYALAQSTNLYVVASNANCSSAAVEITVVVNQAPGPFPAVQASFCAGENIILAAENVANTDVAWFSDAGLTENIGNGATLNLPANTATTVYAVYTANIGNCTSLPQAFTTDIIPLVNANIEILSGSLPLCNGATALLGYQGFGAALWNGIITGSTFSVNSPGNVVLEVTGGCNSSADTLLVTTETVSAAFGYSINTNNTAPAILTLAPQASNCVWTLNGTEVVPVNNQLNIETEGAYTLVHFCESSSGCADQVSQSFELFPDKVEVTIPNSFTPNGDGFNDVFNIKAQGLKELRASIFNRWGQKIFEWEGFGQGWNGNVNNRPASEGVYFYIVEAKDFFDQSVQKAGSITLLRN